jgi:hypothetical protein
MDMQMFLGALITIIAFVAIGKIFLSGTKHSHTPSPYIYRQSTVHHLVHPFIHPSIFNKTKKESQAVKHFNKTNIKVIIMDGSAFWIKDNVFYTAQITDGGVDKDTTSAVDTTHMDKVQLDKMLFIIDQLRDGNINDSGGSGN